MQFDLYIPIFSSDYSTKKRVHELYRSASTWWVIPEVDIPKRGKDERRKGEEVTNYSKETVYVFMFHGEHKKRQAQHFKLQLTADQVY